MLVDARWQNRVGKARPAEIGGADGRDVERQVGIPIGFHGASAVRSRVEVQTAAPAIG